MCKRVLLIAASACCLGAADSSLLDAVKRRDPKSVETLIRQKADVNAAQPDGGTALAWAVHLGDRTMAEMLLAAGAKADVANEYGETPLALACLNGDAVLVDKLLKAGASAKSARWNGETALMIAAGVGSVDVLKLLIAGGADINAVESRKGQSALLWAAAESHPDAVQFLIEKGADIKVASKAGFSALVFATVRNDVRSVQALLAAGADPNYALPDGAKVLGIAANNRSTASAVALIERGADAGLIDRGNTLLHVAAQNGDIELLKKLIAKGLAVDAKTPNTAAGGGRGGGGGFRAVAGGQTPLLVAARAGQIESMKALLAAGADPKAKAQDGTSFLMASIGSAKVDAVKLAYQYDNDVKVVNSSGNTLMHATVSGTANGGTLDAQLRIVEVIRFIAEKGAPVDELNAAGKTPIDVADVLPIDKAVELMTELILKSGLKPKHPSLR